MPGSGAERRKARVEHLRYRDGDACWLCNTPIDFSLDHTNRMGVSLDHILERRNGGHTELANLRLAHKRCNNKRDTLYPHTAGELASHPPVDVESIFTETINPDERIRLLALRNASYDRALDLIRKQNASAQEAWMLACQRTKPEDF